MMDASEFTHSGFKTTEVCIECTWCIPSRIPLKVIFYVIVLGLSVYDTYTDWIVVLNFKDNGFNNPLLPRDDVWLYAWYTFAGIGTFLTLLFILLDGFDLLYAFYQCCKKEPESKKQSENQMIEMDEINASKKEQQEEDEEEIDDLCNCCFQCGWNKVSRSETLATTALWLQHFPLLVLGILYTFSQATCKTPDPKDITSSLFKIGISASAAIATSSLKLLKSLYHSFTRTATKWTPCETCCANNCGFHRSKAWYPQDTCARWCYAPCCCLLLFRAIAIIVLAIVTGMIWFDYVELTNKRNFDDSLGVYRHSITSEKGLLLFNISENIIPPNGIFLNLEKISYMEFPENNNDVFCFSGFEYRPEDFQIYYNAIELVVVSTEGEFCDTLETGSNSTFCAAFYAQNYYASIDPVTGEIRPFDDQCSVVKDRMGFSKPRVDPNIDIYQHLNRTGFPENGEPLVILYPDLNIHYLVSDVLASQESQRQLNTIILNVASSGETTLSCAVDFWYIEISGQIRYNYLDVINLGENNCACISTTDICEALHRNLVYGYLNADQTRVTEYTHCSTIPYDKLVPNYWDRIPVRCPCNYRT